jgi:hypothetical protein
MKTQEDVMQYIRDCKEQIKKYDEEIWKYFVPARELEALQIFKKFDVPNLYDEKVKELQDLKSNVHEELGRNILYLWEIEL